MGDHFYAPICFAYAHMNDPPFENCVFFLDRLKPPANHAVSTAVDKAGFMSSFSN